MGAESASIVARWASSKVRRSTINILFLEVTSSPIQFLSTGVISRINLNDQTVTLERPFQNGVSCKFPEITLNAADIEVGIVDFRSNK